MNRQQFALILLCVASPLAAQSFEGTVTMNVSSESGPGRTMSYMLKGGKLRFEPPGGKMSVIIDPATQRMMVIMDAQKMYMERSFATAAAAAQQRVAGKSPTVTRTGKMETVAGYRCEDVIVTDNDGAAATVCVSSELGGFRMPMASNPMAPQAEAGWVTQLGKQAFPLKVEKNGKVILEVTAIDRKTLDPALFAAPEGYQSFAMPVAPKKPPAR